MKCIFCSEEAVAQFDFGKNILNGIEGIKWLCQDHFNNFSNYAKGQRGGKGEEEQDCNYCRGAYDEKGNYDPAHGKVFGRFNKRTKECDNFACDYYSFLCGYCHRKAKGALKVYCSENCKTRSKEAREKEKNRKPQSCSECGGKLGDTYYHDGTGERQGKFCSQTCYQKIYKVHLEKVKELKNSMKNWEDISSHNWENADWLDEKDKENCREYEKNRKRREKIMQEGGDYSNQTNNSDKIEENFTPPAVDTNSNPSNSSNKKFDAKCEDCNIEIGVGTHCPSCFEKKTKPSNSQNGNNSDKSNLPLPSVKFSDSNSSQDKIFRESLEEMKNNGGKGIIFPTNISPKQRIFLEVINDARLGRYSGENRLDYDKLKLSESEKKELEALLENLEISVNSSRILGGPNQQSAPFLFKHAGKIIGAAIVIIVLIIFLIVAKRKKKVKITKRGKI